MTGPHQGERLQEHSGTGLALKARTGLGENHPRGDYNLPAMASAISKVVLAPPMS